MLADRLKKSVREIMDLTTLELDLWVAYYKIESDANNEAARRARSKGTSKWPARRR